MKAETEILPWKAFFAPSLEQDCCLGGQEGKAGFHQAAPRAMGTWTWAHSSPFQILQMAGKYTLNTEYSRIFFCRSERVYGTALEEPDGLQSQVAVIKHQALLWASCIPIFSCLVMHCFLQGTLTPFIVQNCFRKGEKRARGGTCNL